MVWVSNKQSLENREVSFLAIVEIILAIYAYWAIAFYYDFYWHIVASIAIAPMFLLQSSQSSKMALDIFFRIQSNLKMLFFAAIVIDIIIIWFNPVILDIFDFFQQNVFLMIFLHIFILIILVIIILIYKNNTTLVTSIVMIILLYLAIPGLIYLLVDKSNLFNYLALQILAFPIVMLGLIVIIISIQFFSILDRHP